MRGNGWTVVSSQLSIKTSKTLSVL